MYTSLLIQHCNIWFMCLWRDSQFKIGRETTLLIALQAPSISKLGSQDLRVIWSGVLAGKSLEILFIAHCPPCTRRAISELSYRELLYHEITVIGMTYSLSHYSNSPGFLSVLPTFPHQRVPPAVLFRVLVLTFDIPGFHYDHALKNPLLPKHLHTGRVGSQEEIQGNNRF